MQWEIVFEQPNQKDTYKGKPGRLFTPTPRNQNEVVAAVQELLVRKGAVRITIQEVPAKTISNPPHHD